MLSLKYHIEIIRGTQYHKIAIDIVVFRLEKNFYFKTSNDDIILLKNFVYHRTLFFVSCKFQKHKDFYIYPLPSSELDIIYVSQLQEKKIAYSFSDVQMLFNSKDNYLLLHTKLHWYKEAYTASYNIKWNTFIVHSVLYIYEYIC